MCNLARRAPQNLEKVAKNPVEKVASNPVTSVAVMVFSALTQISEDCSRASTLAWPPLQSLAVKKNFFFVQILGGEKLIKFVEKVPVKYFKWPERG